MGIDVSDACLPSEDMSMLKDCECINDDIGIGKTLILNTKLKVRTNEEPSVTFKVTIGSFQWDSLSAKVFTLYLAIVILAQLLT